MRTNIDLDNKLIADAIEMSGLRTKKAVVEEALRMLTRDWDAARGQVKFWDDAQRKAIPTNLDVNETLMATALETSGMATKAAVVDEALRIYVRRLAIEDLRSLRGKVEFWPGWEEERLKEHGVEYSS